MYRSTLKIGEVQEYERTYGVYAIVRQRKDGRIVAKGLANHVNTAPSPGVVRIVFTYGNTELGVSRAFGFAIDKYRIEVHPVAYAQAWVPVFTIDEEVLYG